MTPGEQLETLNIAQVALPADQYGLEMNHVLIPLENNYRFAI
jgi:hypothetical protein